MKQLKKYSKKCIDFNYTYTVGKSFHCDGPLNFRNLKNNSNFNVKNVANIC